MSTTITVIPGDGIGPEVTSATLEILKAAGAALDYDMQAAGVAALESHHSPLPDVTLDSLRRNKVSLKGPLTTPVGTGFRSINVAIRKEFDLYANVRPARSLVPGGRYEDIDLVLIRENTEGLYVGVEHYIGVGNDPRAAAESVMIITRFGAERAVRYAFDFARRNGRRKVTLAHKANILKYTQGLFLEAGREVARDYPEIVFEDRIIDATAMQLVMNPWDFDVLVMENMFGDILSDLMAGLVGGLGSPPPGTSGPTPPCSRRCTAPPPTSPARGWRIHPPSSWPPACSWSTWGSTTPPPASGRRWRGSCAPAIPQPSPATCGGPPAPASSPRP
jgi:isocitrate dehydrogenase (NAD+)